MKLRPLPYGLIAHDGERDRWVRLSLGAMLAYASAAEKLDAGDAISTGTMPGCCGLERSRWIKPGQAVELEIDGIGRLINRVDPQATPA